MSVRPFKHQSLVLLGAALWLIGPVMLALPGPLIGEGAGSAGWLAVHLFWSGMISMALGAVTLAWTWRLTAAPDQSRKFIPLGLLASLGFVLAALGASPWLDDDLLRYLWDGAVSYEGGQPLLTPPASGPHPLTPELWQQIGYKHVHSVYPPLAQVWFQYNWWAWDDRLVGWTVSAAVLGIATLWIMMIAGRKLGAPLAIFALLALHPVFIKEIGDSAHLEGLTCLLVAGALISWIQYRERWWGQVLTGSLLAAAVLVKLTPILLLPFWPQATLRQRIALSFGVVALSMASLFAAWGQSDLWSAFAANLTYFQRYWVFNSGLADALRLGLVDTQQAYQGWLIAGQVSTSLGSVILVSGGLLAVFSRWSPPVIGIITLTLWFASRACFNGWYVLLLWPLVLALPWMTNRRLAWQTASLPLSLGLVGQAGYAYWAELADLMWLRVLTWSLWWLWFVYVAVSLCGVRRSSLLIHRLLGNRESRRGALANRGGHLDATS